MRTVVITGASRGLGRAVAQHFAEAERARVVLLGRDAAALDETAAGVRAAGGSAEWATVDVVDRAALARVAANVGAVDVLVASAGNNGPTPVDGGPDVDAMFDALVATNLVGAWNTVRAFVPSMGEGGRIVLVASVLGRFGVPGMGGYVAAKHGLVGLTKALGLELAPRRIFVNAVAPGWIETDMAQSSLADIARATGVDVDEARRRAEAALPLGRFFRADEIARGIAWLADPRNEMQLGTCLNLDGGQVQY